MEKTCFNCKYEPNWKHENGEGINTITKSGFCKFKLSMAKLPKTFMVSIRPILVFENGYGVIEECPAWSEKLSKYKFDDRLNCYACCFKNHCKSEYWRLIRELFPCNFEEKGHNESGAWIEL